MHHYPLLEILAVGFSLALIFGYLAKRLGLSPIVGYLLAGFVIGPQMPGFVAEAHLAHELSEAGVILLMFGVGLHFNLNDLLAVRGVSLPGAIIQSTCATLCGLLVAHCFGMSLMVGFILGLGLAVASTVVLLRVLTDNHVLETVQGHVAVGWLVVEDILTVLALVLLPNLAIIYLGQEEINALGLAKVFGGAILRLVLLWVVVLVVGGRVVPWLLTRVVRSRSQELFTLAVLSAAFATAVVSAKCFGASMALGAFLGGMVIGKTKVSYQAGANVLPFQDAFAVLFFLAVGMLFDPAFLVREPWLVLGCLIIVMVVKPLVAVVAVSFLGYSAMTGLTVAAGLAQVGEFSFILAQEAKSCGILVNDDVYSALVITAFVSISLNPFLFRKIPGFLESLKKYPRLWYILNVRADRRAARKNENTRELSGVRLEHGEKSFDPDNIFAVVVGYGPVGQSVCHSLTECQVTPVVIDLNVDTVNNLNDLHLYAVYGDATKKEVLLGAGIKRARYLILTLPSLSHNAAAATVAKQLNPEIQIMARTRFIADAGFLEQAGVKGIAFEEEVVADFLANQVLKSIEKEMKNSEESDFTEENLLEEESALGEKDKAVSEEMGMREGKEDVEEKRREE
ncbi:MAG: cation:proton antiporter [Planctomycetia bacterium]|nr:cation:proton antiporter [Planctomycetia bacterium]